MILLETIASDRAGRLTGSHPETHTPESNESDLALILASWLDLFFLLGVLDLFGRVHAIALDDRHRTLLALTLDGGMYVMLPDQGQERDRDFVCFGFFNAIGLRRGMNRTGSQRTMAYPSGVRPPSTRESRLDLSRNSPKPGRPHRSYPPSRPYNSHPTPW
jgi:hypothetical protein